MANPLVSYIRESREELRKVVWPSRRETANHTLLVIALSVFLAIFLGAMDYLLNQLLKLVVK